MKAQKRLQTSSAPYASLLLIDNYDRYTQRAGYLQTLRPQKLHLVITTMAASCIVRFTEHLPTNQVGPIGTVAHLVRRVVTNQRYQQSPVQSTASSEKNIRGKQGKNETKKIIEKKEEKSEKTDAKPPRQKE